MNDDWNLHDAVEDGIRDNAGHLALTGALLAHSQRKQQLQALESSRQHQAQIARTEAERLEVEKQRLELERLKQQTEKDEKEAVRLLRVLMAEVGAEFDLLSSRGGLKGSPQGVRRDYVMAVLLSKLALVRSRSTSLSELNDLKELARLENQAQDLVPRHFARHDPLQVARGKWREIEAWMQVVESFEQEVKTLCSAVPEPSSVELPGKLDLDQKRTLLENELGLWKARLQEHAAALPPEAALEGVLLPELIEQAQLEELREGCKTSRSRAFAHLWQQVAVVRRPSELGMVETNEVFPGLVQQVESALAGLMAWETKHGEQEQELSRLEVHLEEGHIGEAATEAARLGNVRYADLNYQPVSKFESVQNALKDLEDARRGGALLKVAQLRRQYPNAREQSALGIALSAHSARGRKELWTTWIAAAAVIAVAAGIGKVVVDNYKEEQRLVAEAKAEHERTVAEAKAEHERTLAEAKAQHDRTVAEARAKTEAERLEHERLAAEAKAKAEAEKRERERIMGKNFTNSLGMKFVGVPGTQVLMCIHETRNADYAAYTAAQSEVDRSLRSEAVGKEQHPVVQVSYEDAEDFCLWLSVKEGKIYRMPTDAEWSAAVGLLKETGRTPKEKNDNGTKDVFPWGSYWPPKTQDGNYGLREVNDGYDGIAPVMSFRPNELGIYDLGGNVWEWCQDWRDDTKDVRVLRGGAWRTDVPSFLLSSCRDFVWPGHRGGCGFRLVLVLESGG